MFNLTYNPSTNALAYNLIYSRSGYTGLSPVPYDMMCIFKGTAHQTFYLR